MTNEFTSNGQSASDKQHLSDLLDDCSSAEAVDKLLADEAHGEAWYRYNTVSAVLKKEHSAFSSFDFTQAISAQIEQEPAILSRPKPKKSNVSTIGQFWKRTGGGLAIAASVAYAMIFSVEMMNSSSEAGLVGNDIATIQVEQTPIEMPTAILSDAEAEEQARLNEIQNILNNINMSGSNVYEQQVSGELIVKTNAKPDPLAEFERQVNNMKKPSEVETQKNR